MEERPDLNLQMMVGTTVLGLQHLKRHTKSLTEQTKKMISLQYPTGTRLFLDGREIEIIVDTDPFDVYYDSSTNTAKAIIYFRYLDQEYQNINLWLLKKGTVSRDKSNSYPGLQHYSRKDLYTISDVPSIFKKALDIAEITVRDYNK